MQSKHYWATTKHAYLSLSTLFFTVLEFPYSHSKPINYELGQKSILFFIITFFNVLISPKPVWRDSTTTIFTHTRVWSRNYLKPYAPVHPQWCHSARGWHFCGTIPPLYTNNDICARPTCQTFLLHLSLSIIFRWPYIAYRFSVKKTKRILFLAPLHDYTTFLNCAIHNSISIPFPTSSLILFTISPSCLISERTTNRKTPEYISVFILAHLEIYRII